MSSDISQRKLGNPFFNEKNYKSYPLDEKNFHEIKASKNQKKLAFIDGGNQELLPAPEYSVQLNRVYFNIFRNNERISLRSNISQRIEFLSFTSSKMDGKNIEFQTKIAAEENFLKYLPNERDLKASTYDEEIETGTQAGMERMASMARRFSEWTIAEHIIDSELDSGDIIIKDGSLQTGHTNEYKYVDKVFKKALEKDVIFAGLSKTCRLTTDTQISLVDSIQRLSEESNVSFDKWCYYPVAMSKEENSNHRALIMIVKLNKHAYTSFRFEILKEQADEMEEDDILEVLSLVADNSRDIRLPGYPYGLIDADMWARVKNDELEGYKTKLYSELSKNGVWSKVNPLMKIVDTHEKLDNK